ncbi:retrotransposon protein, putative, ty1-copia subclass [Tanacetum coccineum]
MVNETMAKEKQSPLVNTTGLGSFPPLPTQETTVLGSFPPLPTQVTTSACNAPGKSSYANVTGKPSGKKVNIHTMFTLGGNGIDVVISVESIRAISERFANTSYGFFLGKRVAYPVVANYARNTWGKYGLVRSIEDGLSAIATKLGTPLMLDSYTSDMCMQSWGRSSYARVMIELRTDMDLKDNTVVAMPKITREGHYICNVHVEYEWKSPRCASCKVFRHIHKECPENTGAGEKKTVKKPSQTSRGVPVGSKMGFKPHKEYRPVPKKPTASSSSNNKKGVEPTIEVSNLNPFEVLNSVNNDVDNGTTPIIDKTEKFEELLTSGQPILVDEAGNPLKKVEFLGDYDSEDEVASVDNDMAHSMALERVGFGTQSLLEQWRDLYGNGDYDEDPYDDDMYEGQDLTQEL